VYVNYILIQNRIPLGVCKRLVIQDYLFMCRDIWFRSECVCGGGGVMVGGGGGRQSSELIIPCVWTVC
jgi:hypothetical protein